MNSDLPYREENLTSSEKWVLLKRFVFVMLFGLLMLAVLIYFMFFWDDKGDVPLPVVVFLLFFSAVLGLILFVHGRNAFQNKKRIYEGTITDKTENTAKFRKGIGNSTFSISLDEVPFSVDLYFYNQVAKGQRVQLHTLKGNVVFKVNAISKVEPVSQSISQLESLNPEYREVLKKRLMSLIVWRTLFGFAAAALAYFLLNFAAILLLKNVQTLLVVVYLNLGCVILSYFLVNRKTFRVVMDLVQKQQEKIVQRVIDLQKSNLPKPSKNSVRTYQGYWYKNDLFFYVQTENHWLQISEQLYEELMQGDAVLLVQSAKAKIILDIKKYQSVNDLLT